ncbi:MAG: hypothetical protein IPI67_39180 [Myxococcales bacterium]|nr:hypothetical protein [Myxococcales bacterium]
MKRVGALLAVGFGFLTAGACSSDDAGELRRAKLAEGCLVNSDCSQTPEPLVCAFQRCHVKCNTDADCEKGLRCMLADKPVHVCQLPDELPSPPCKYSSECPGEQVCGVDGECRDACKTDKDCVSQQLCVSSTCASKEELTNGQLEPQPGVDGGTKECEYNSECPADQVCRPQGTCGLECKGVKDCATGQNCVGSKCVSKGGPATLPDHCKNALKDGDESGIDCGGSCYPCPTGGDCTKKEDCTSQSCAASKCQEPTCGDGVRNGSETGTDCGGPSCTACPAAQTCNVPADCSAGICKSGTCVDASCADGQQNGDETDIDCGGGTCPACDGANKGCVIGGDCTSGVCTAYSCALPTCTDGLKNGKETAQDCGGAECKPCSAGKGCAQAGDCVSKVCMTGTCVAATCTDTVKNGNETDTDCGGSDCDKCASGKACVQATDCSAGGCVGNVCKATFKLTITPAGTGAGTVKSDVGGVDCGATCSADILDGTSVVLTATAASTSTFTSWAGGGCTGTGTCSLTLTADTTLTASFGGVAPGGVVLTKPLGNAYSTAYPGGTDAAGNYYFHGVFNGSHDFGGGPVSANAYDGFIAKYSPSGAWLWSRKLGGAGEETVERMVIEPSGDVVLIGRGTAATGLDFGGAPTSCNAGGLILGRYAGADGAHKWSKCVGSGVDTVTSAVLDGSGNVVVAGTLANGTTDFGTGPLSAQGTDMFVASFALSNGAAVAAKDFGGASDDRTFELARAADGSFALVGECTGNVDFGSGIVTTGKGGTDLCVAKLSSAWVPAWVRQLGDLGADTGYSAAFAPSGKLVVTGVFNGQVDFDTGTVDVAKGGGDIVLAQINPTTGAIEWHKVYGTTAVERASHLAIAANGDIVLVGGLEAPLGFGGPQVPAGLFCVKLSSTAAFVWSSAFYAPPSGASLAVGLTPSGGVMLGTQNGGVGAEGLILAP